MQTNFFNTDTICAVATPHGMGAIAVVRVSGPEAISVVSQLFTQNKKPFDIEKTVSHKAYYGHIEDNGDLLDEARCPTAHYNHHKLALCLISWVLPCRGHAYRP